MAQVCENLKLDKTVIFVTKGNNENLIKASGNLKNVDVTTANILNTYDDFCCDKVVLTVDAINEIQEAYVI